MLNTRGVATRVRRSSNTPAPRTRHQHFTVGVRSTVSHKPENDDDLRSRRQPTPALEDGWCMHSNDGLRAFQWKIHGQSDARMHFDRQRLNRKKDVPWHVLQTYRRTSTAHCFQLVVQIPTGKRTVKDRKGARWLQKNLIRVRWADRIGRICRQRSGDKATLKLRTFQSTCGRLPWLKKESR